MMGCVYVIHALTTNYYKIGRTTNIESRMYGIQLTVPFFELEVVATHYHKKYKEIEKRLHKLYIEKQLKNSEWFELTGDDLSTATMNTVDLVDSLQLNDNKVDIHELFLQPKKDDTDGESVLVIKKPFSHTPHECLLLRQRLKHLRDAKNMKWRDIGEMPEFNGVSFGTLNAIYHGREPKATVTRRKLGLPFIEVREIYRNGAGRFIKRRG